MTGRPASGTGSAGDRCKERTQDPRAVGLWPLKVYMSKGAHLLLGVDETRRDTCGIDATVGILMDLDVGPAVAGIGVTGAIEQVKDLFIVEL